MRSSLRRTMPALAGVALLATAGTAHARPLSDATAARQVKTLDLASLTGVPSSLQGGGSFTLRGRVVNLTRSARLTLSLRSAAGTRHLRGATLRKARSRSFALRVTVPANLDAGTYTVRACVRSSRGGGKSRCSSRTLRLTAALSKRPGAVVAPPPAAPSPTQLGATPQATATATATVDVGGTVEPTPTATATATPIPEGAPLHSLRAPLTGENFYFVMADRFENGSTANDTGGIPGDYHQNGFDPTKKGYYHGGDLKGLLGKIDYIQGLGTTAIWLTPSFKNRAVQGTGANESAGYHGYWVTDFTQIDPHLGTNEDLRNVITAAHARGMKVFFDIITNHTADVIQYQQNTTAYVPKDTVPYKTAAGNPFDDRDYAGTDSFPALDPATSFPYVPTFANAADATVKVPSWLNDTTLYHNRGDTDFTGENSQYGDFFGLDDLFTEQPRVVNGMIDIYDTWVRDMKIDGFRIDTMKHVNDEFWQKFSPTVLQYAKDQGKSDFFMFGEVADSTRQLTSHFTTHNDVQSVLDFPFFDASRDFASRSKATNGLRDLFQGDDWYTDADSNAYQLPTFLGNHDAGHVGMFLRDDNAGAPESELLARDKLAHALMYFARGNPVVYFGDEQGFTGAGNDQAARQDMFPSKDPEYDNQGPDDGGKNDNIGSDKTPMDDNFDTSHPLYQEIKKLADLTKAEPALRNGAMQHRYSSDAAGIYAFSRWTRGVDREYVVALNNAKTAKTAAIPTFMTSASFNRIYGSGSATLRSDVNRNLTVTVPPLSAVVYKALGTIPRSPRAPSVAVVAPAHNAEGSDRMEVRADVGGDSSYEVTFWSKVGDDPWAPIGTDDNAPYRVFHDVSDLQPGTAVHYQAVVLDNAGHSARSNVRQARVGKPSITWDVPAEGAKVRGATTVRVLTAPEHSYYSVTFLRRIGEGAWTPIALDDSSPVYSATDNLPTLPTGTTVTYRAVLDYGSGTVTSTDRSVVAAPPPVTQAVIHYNGSATTWGLHLFGDGLAPGQATAEWTNPTAFEASDSYGPLHRITIADDTKRVGFIVHQRPPNENTKDPDNAPDRFFTPAECPEIWVQQGVLAYSCTKPAL